MARSGASHPSRQPAPHLTMRAFLALALMLPLAACQQDSDPGPGGVTRGEARALDEAATMLDSRPAPPPLVDATVPADAASAAP
ncbi:hypothetical protein [Novosphingobium sp. GV055]|uniref:hypothetical protein n=2 Tax=Sphingomonadaceae TaxID=41297 RepID=UPI001E419C24|nr:hypothetical protein [Novosphingobium sp. GV055]